jgi:tRNA (uracil-5-)-methyltransferase
MLHIYLILKKYIFVFVLQKCGQVLGLELLTQAVDDAKSNAEDNDIKNCDFFVGKAEEILSSVMKRAVKEDILAVVDPPRAGLRKDFILLNICYSN